jgi:hypothetical protein
MHKAVAILLVLPGVPVPAQRAAPVTLIPGEALTVRIGDRGTVTASEREPSAMTEFEAAAIHALLAGAGCDAGPNLKGFTSRHLPGATPVAKGRVRLKFVRLPARGSVLFLENGYRKALAYRAHIRAGDSATATDVCVVLPRLRAHEHWPFPIDSIELTDFRLEAWREGDPIRCE